MVKGSNLTKSPAIQPSTCRVLRQRDGAPIAENDLTNISGEGKTILRLILSKLEEHKIDILAKLEEKNQVIAVLKKDNLSLKQRLASLENQVEDLTMQARCNDVIVSGDKIPSSFPGEICSNIVIETIRRELNYSLEVNKVASAYRIGGKPATQGEDKRGILVRLANPEDKKDLIQSCKRAKPSGLYINESLTQARTKILYALRQAKRSFPGRIDGCGSHDGRIYAWIKPKNGEGRNLKRYINDVTKLGEWCETHLEIKLADLQGFRDEI